MAGKVNSKTDHIVPDGASLYSCAHPSERYAEKFLETFSQTQRPPQQKYSLPQTSSQEYGWDHEPLVCVHLLSCSVLMMRLFNLVHLS